jgi:hypothetical protein
MPPSWRVAALAALVLLPALAPAQQPAPSLPVSAPASPFHAPPPELLSTLEDDHVVVNEPAPPAGGERVGITEAMVLFEQPRATVVRMLAETARQIEYRPELKNLQIVEATEQSDLAEYRVRFMLTTLTYRAHHGWDLKAGRVWWTLDGEFPNDMQRLDGLWELRALDERRTLGHFSTRIDLGPALPGFLQDYATRQKLPESMENVRRWVDSGGRWRP